ncbi:MAG TPA: MdtA/MuxA family multidrug efflux RND transporter periplasmic adaptor subunit [Candidatus Eremiobacteraceae bacterium]|nr:MdtA/MuxA family multidrug efflux RND transporter periplasmic adaptor subunit [Candidatus Eremiobacteraceae bacterium]
MPRIDEVDVPSAEEPGARLKDSLPNQQPRRNSWWMLVLLGALATGGWWYYHSRGTPATGAAVAAEGTTPGDAAAAVPVVVATAHRGNLPVYFDGLGTVTAFNTVVVKSRVDGQIVKINFTEGQNVKQGDALIEIDPRPYQVQLEQAEGQLAKDQAQLKDVQIDYERYQTLFKDGVIPRQQVDTQLAQVGMYEGAIKADQAAIDNAKLQITYAHITAPITGRVGLRLVDVGNIVHATDTNGLLVITQLQPIAVLFSLPQDQLPEVITKMRPGNPLNVEAYDRDNSEKIATGKLLTIDNQIDTTTGTYKLKAVFDNAKNELFPNQFVNVHLLIDTRKNVVLVPTTAILRGQQGSTYVFAVNGKNTVSVKNVKVANTTGNLAGLSAGLNDGDVVVVDGQDKLKEGTLIEPHTQRVGTSDAAQSSQTIDGGAGSRSGGPAR